MISERLSHTLSQYSNIIFSLIYNLKKNLRLNNDNELFSFEGHANYANRYAPVSIQSPSQIGILERINRFRYNNCCNYIDRLHYQLPTWVTLCCLYPVMYGRCN